MARARVLNGLAVTGRAGAGLRRARPAAGANPNRPTDQDQDQRTEEKGCRNFPGPDQAL